MLFIPRRSRLGNRRDYRNRQGEGRRNVRLVQRGQEDVGGRLGIVGVVGAGGVINQTVHPGDLFVTLYSSPLAEEASTVRRPSPRSHSKRARRQEKPEGR